MSSIPAKSVVWLAVPSGGRTAAAVPSLAEVYERHVAYVFRVLRALGVRGAALDDAVQDVFVAGAAPAA